MLHEQGCVDAQNIDFVQFHTLKVFFLLLFLICEIHSMSVQWWDMTKCSPWRTKKSFLLVNSLTVMSQCGTSCLQRYRRPAVWQDRCSSSWWERTWTSPCGSRESIQRLDMSSCIQQPEICTSSRSIVCDMFLFKVMKLYHLMSIAVRGMFWVPLLALSRNV